MSYHDRKVQVSVPCRGRLCLAGALLWLAVFPAGACSSKQETGNPSVDSPDMTAMAAADPGKSVDMTVDRVPDMTSDAPRPDATVKNAPVMGAATEPVAHERAKTPNSSLIEYEKHESPALPKPALVLAKAVEGKPTGLTAADFQPKLQALSAGLAGLAAKAGDPREVFSKVFPDFKAASGTLKSFPELATAHVLELQDPAVLGLLVRLTPAGFKRCAGNGTSREGTYGVFVTAGGEGPLVTLHEFEKLDAFLGFEAALQAEKPAGADLSVVNLSFRNSNREEVIKDKVARGLYCEPESDPSEYTRTYRTVFVFEKGVLRALRTLQVSGSSTTVGRTSEYRAALSWITTEDGLFLVDTVVEHDEYPDTTGESDAVRTVCSKVDYLFDAGVNGHLRTLTPASVKKLRAIKGYEQVKADVELADAKGCAALLKP